MLKDNQHDSTIFNIKSPEFFINMKPSDIPPRGHPDRQAFLKGETDKGINGVNINGIFIPGSLYYDLNYHFIELDTEQGRIVGNPKLRDNGWIIHNDYHLAQKEKKHYAIAGGRQLGKDLLNSSKLFTQNGNIEIGNSKVGDKIFDDSGKLTTIIGVYPQGKKSVYKITMLDGRELFCGLDHNWYIYDNGKHGYYKKTTGELLTDYKCFRKSWKNRKNPYSYRYRIDYCKPINYHEKKLNIDPYILGTWLGDKDSRRFAITTADLYIVERLKEFAKNHNLRLSIYDDKKSKAIHCNITGVKGKTNILTTYLKDLNLVLNKHIPNEYKYSSYDQRLELLRGLMDSDGTSNCGSSSFSNSNYTLIKDVEELVRSLGMGCSLKIKKTKSKKQSYNLQIYTDIQIFNLSRKYEKQKKTKFIKGSSIVNIEYVFEDYTTCIEVDNKSHLFLTDGFTITHNSDILTSLTMREIALFDGTAAMLLFSNSEDKVTFSGKMKIAHDHQIDFFKVPLLDKDFNKSFLRFGFKETTNDNELHAKLYLLNTDGGNNAEIAASKTITFFAFDEIAKAPFKESWDAAQPAFRGKFGFRNAGFFAFCVCKGSQVYDNFGKSIKIENLIKENGIVGYGGEGPYQDTISNIYPVTKKECVRITAEGGNSIECSIDHPILHSKRDYKKTIKGIRKKVISFKEAGDLRVGEQLAFIDQVDFFGKKSVKDARFLGLMIGDGSYGSLIKKESQIGTDSTDLKNFLEKKYNAKILENQCFKTKAGLIYNRYYIPDTKVLFTKHGILGQTKENKRVPSDIHTWDYQSVSEFIGGYFDADGNITEGKNTKIVLSSIVKELLEEVKFLLLKFGIHSTIYKENRNGKNSLGTRDYIYRLYISKIEDVRLFKKYFYFLQKDKQKRLDNISNTLKGNKKIEGYYFNDKGTICTDFDFKNLRFNIIKNIEYLGLQDVYNITTSDTHTYIVNGIVTHNTGGNVQKSQDAEKFFTNPKANNVLSIKGTGRFMDGTHRADLKKEGTFVEFLHSQGIDVKKGSELDYIPCEYVDKEEATKILDSEAEELLKSGETKSYNKHKIYNPRKVSDMFLKEEANPFSDLSVQLEQLYEYLNTQDYHTQTYRLEEKGDKVEAIPVDKHYDPFSTDKDQPIVILDMPRDIGSGKLYVAGLDNINVNKTSQSSSIASFYIMRKSTSDYSDPYQDTMVAWYNGRKDMNDLREKLRLTLKFYGADFGSCTLLHEAPDDTLTQWFMDKKIGYWLENTYQLAKQIFANTKAFSAKGLRPTTRNQDYYISRSRDYLTEELPDGRLGLWRIKDKLLVKQYLSFDGDLGVCDAMVGFGHAVTHLYKERNYVPRVSKKEDAPVSASEIMQAYKSGFGFNLPKNQVKKTRSII